MNKYILPLALVSIATLQACNQKPPTTASAPVEAEPAAALSLTKSEDRLSYGIGYSMGQRMVADGVPLNGDAFAAGLKDSLEGAEARMTPEEIQAEMQAYQEKAQAEHQAAQEELAAANKALADAFLAENAAKEGVVVTDSGLQYEVLTAGEGPKPGPEDTVEVHYRGTLVDGTEFDSSYKRGQTVTFGVNQVIPGWTEALQLMPVGSKWKLAIPSDLAYGPGGAGQVIGPNAALLFEVELIGIPSQEEGGDEKGADAAGKPAADAG